MSDIKVGDRVEVTRGRLLRQRGTVAEVLTSGDLGILLDGGEHYAINPDALTTLDTPPPQPAPNPFVQLAERALDYAKDVRGGEQANWAAIGQGYALLALATKEGQ